MNIVNVFKPLTISVKRSISDDLQGSEYGLGKSLLKVKRGAHFLVKINNEDTRAIAADVFLLFYYVFLSTSSSRLLAVSNVVFHSEAWFFLQVTLTTYSRSKIKPLMQHLWTSSKFNLDFGYAFVPWVWIVRLFSSDVLEEPKKDFAEEVFQRCSIKRLLLEISQKL